MIGKKGINDAGIFTIILMPLILLSVILPFIEADLNPTNKQSQYAGNLEQPFSSENLGGSARVSAGEIIKSIGKVLFWSFGDFPFWLEAILSVFRITLIFILIKNLTPLLGGG